MQWEAFPSLRDGQWQDLPYIEEPFDRANVTSFDWTATMFAVESQARSADRLYPLPAIAELKAQASCGEIMLDDAGGEIADP
jgi:hypothetical protein